MRINLTLSFMLLVSCSPKNKESNYTKLVENEIRELETSSDKEKYLTSLFEQDQSNRLNDDKYVAIVSKHGLNSNEFKEYAEHSIKIDIDIFNKLKLYLEMHGYTEDIKKFRYEAKSAFPYITGHHTNFENQKYVLTLLAPAYKNGVIVIDDIVWIMSEMHELKYGELFKLNKSSYKVEDEFDGLVEKLDLNKIFQ